MEILVLNTGIQLMHNLNQALTDFIKALQLLIHRTAFDLIHDFLCCFNADIRFQQYDHQILQKLLVDAGKAKCQLPNAF